MFTLLLLKSFGGYWGIRTKFYKHRRLKLFFKFLIKFFNHYYGAYVPLGFKLKGPINFIHGAYGVFISEDAEIGRNCTIYHHVTIGSNTLLGSKKLGAPKIGDNCLIGSGAKIIGNVTIGNNCRVGANCVVACDVPDNSTIVMQKPLIIQNNEFGNKAYTRTSSGWGYVNEGQIINETDPVVLDQLSKSFPR